MSNTDEIMARRESEQARFDAVLKRIDEVLEPKTTLDALMAAKQQLNLCEAAAKIATTTEAKDSAQAGLMAAKADYNLKAVAHLDSLARATAAARQIDSSTQYQSVAAASAKIWGNEEANAGDRRDPNVATFW